MPRMPWEITPEMFLSLEEVEALLAHVRRKPNEIDSIGPGLDQVIIETLLFSGIRNSELCRLTLGDLTVTGSRCMLRVRGTGHENRDVHIPRALGVLLRQFVSGLRRELLPKETRPGDASQPLLLNERGRPYERTGLYRRVTRILTEAGLGDRASVQLMRHTYGYLAYRQTGGNLLFVQRQLGHAHPMITSVYARLVEESYEDLAETLSFEARNSPKARRIRR